jgi:hypothetical protein
VSPEERYNQLLTKEAELWTDSSEEIEKVANIGMKLRSMLGRGSRAAAPIAADAGEISAVALRDAIKHGKRPIESLNQTERALLAKADSSPLTWGLGAAGLGGAAGHHVASGKADEKANAKAGLGFGAGLASGLAAPAILEQLNSIVGSQGFYPGSEDMLFSAI